MKKLISYFIACIIIGCIFFAGCRAAKLPASGPHPKVRIKSAKLPPEGPHNKVRIKSSKLPPEGPHPKL